MAALLAVMVRVGVEDEMSSSALGLVEMETEGVKPVGVIWSVAESVSLLPAALTTRLLKVAPVPATVVAVSPVAVPLPLNMSVRGTPPIFWPFSVTETTGAAGVLTATPSAPL
jgi:hypothetical protein